MCLDGRVTCEGVSAAYGPEAPIVLHDVSFTVAPGERVAVVGPSGSGKSTLVRLLSGTMDPTDGVIRLDGIALTDLPRSTFHANVGVVEQDIQLFAGTVIDNLTMWDETVGLPTVMEAARAAEIHDVIAALPGGYEALLESGGTNLSGGERQRIELARALVRRPSVLVLDEATSMLDPLTERAVMDNLRRRGCTCLIVAHRLSSIRDCDRIIVLQAGRIVEQGQHAGLLAQAGVYAALIRAA
jgi:ABC-type bacteriocin/lantibiotic exporter with double-glycine peptidase domain